MWGKKKKSADTKVLSSVQVLHFRDGKFSHKLSIHIPDGASFQRDAYGSRVTVVGKDKNALVHYDWQAGFTQKYTYKYRTMKGE